MTGKVLNNGNPAALALIFPIAVIITLVLKTWQVLLSLLVLGLLFSLWQNYQWRRWSAKVNPFFNELVQENQGYLTPIDLSIKANLTAPAAQRFLDKKAEEFGAQIRLYEENKRVYYFLTNRALSGMFADSDPDVEPELETKKPEDKTPTAEDNNPLTPPSADGREGEQETPTQAEAISDQTEEETSLVEETPTQTEEETSLVEETPIPTEEETSLVEETPIPTEEETSLVEETPTQTEEETSLVEETPTQTEEETSLVEETPTQAEAISDQGEETPTQAEAISDQTEEETSLVEETPTQAEAISDQTEEETSLVEETPTAKDEEKEVEVNATNKTPKLNYESTGMIQADLAKRLVVSPKTISKRKSASDFEEWSKSRDPEGISWKYSPATGMFMPKD